jgi:hypothetical protein
MAGFSGALSREKKGRVLVFLSVVVSVMMVLLSSKKFFSGLTYSANKARDEYHEPVRFQA